MLYKRVCPICGKKFETNSGNKKYCSKECSQVKYPVRKKPLFKICENCHKRFRAISKNSKFCSLECGREFNKIRRPSFREWQSLNEFVMERDGYKCVKCDSDINLVVHHIIPLVRRGDNSVENLETLCEKCHIKIHKILSKHYRAL